MFFWPSVDNNYNVFSQIMKSYNAIDINNEKAVC